MARGQLILHWRRWLTERFLEHTFHDRAFYAGCGHRRRLHRRGVLISPMLVAVLVVCVAGGSLLTIAIGRPLV